MSILKIIKEFFGRPKKQALLEQPNDLEGNEGERQQYLPHVFKKN